MGDFTNPVPDDSTVLNSLSIGRGLALADSARMPARRRTTQAAIVMPRSTRGANACFGYSCSKVNGRSVGLMVVSLFSSMARMAMVFYYEDGGGWLRGATVEFRWILRPAGLGLAGVNRPISPRTVQTK